MLQIPIRENLSKLFVKTLRFLKRTPRIFLSSLVILIFITILSILGNFQNQNQTTKFQAQKDFLSNRNIPQKNEDQESSPSSDPDFEFSGEVVVRKIEKPTSAPTSAPSNQEEGKVSTADISSGGSGSAGLFSAVNSFRSSNGLSQVSLGASLCTIAEKRLGELISLGKLDGHAGFNKYFDGQNEYNSMGEITFSSSNSTSPEYAVNEGWAKSTSGHRENMLNTKWNYGCGATNGYFAVFIFGKK